ncbi:peptide ABC transporter substrate-binding protein [Clostridium folliculivorans]|uniref:Peptide ABC transporter substrate-binding protein n=1 Tax=Clostridium folliculivorans TaxID=2886038 RepID=A0A9W6D8A1_9CLOT|nr:peptide ABC transporter substrate-binding protein [Clostridium folliculivorans]GKU23354.1 peptide ABC transporter substrate-binding protein [Clostridium folliculivorans]GKU29471.1 peptide ABC transporter substrate-binding protein [Clostridium folliculivorans]
MLKRNKMKVLSLILATLVVGTTFVGCGKKDDASSTAKVDQVVKYNLGAQPKTIDPGLNNSVEGGIVDVNAFEGLENVDANNKVNPGVAEKYDVSSDGTKYTFHLRKDAKWSDGKNVTANDFYYAWTRALAPETASDYAYQLYYIKNGEAYNGGKAKVSDVGIKVVDDYTLEVTLEAPTAYFLALTAFPTYFPVRKDIVDANKEGWATDAKTFVSNGPYKMSEYAQKDHMTFVKNDNYWDKANVKLDKIQYTLLDNETSALNAFESGEIDATDLLPAEQKQSLIKDGKAKVYPYLGTYYYAVNVSNKNVSADVAKALSNVNVRKALSMAIDRTAIVENVTKGGEQPATSYVPKGIVDSTGKEFKNKDYLKTTADVEGAKKLLADAGYPEGKNFPKLEIKYNTGQGHQNIAQAIQEMWKKNLGIDVTLVNEERKVQLDDLTKHNFMVCRTSWIADYNDPMTFIDMYYTNGGNNNPGYTNPEYDKLVDAAKKGTDAAKRTDDMHKAEDILMNDMPIIPIYYYTNVLALKSNITDLQKSPLGFVYFRSTVVEAASK